MAVERLERWHSGWKTRHGIPLASPSVLCLLYGLISLILLYANKSNKYVIKTLDRGRKIWDSLRAMGTEYKKTAVIDFDNTISGYDKWRGPHVHGPPVPYAKDAIKELMEWGWRVVIFTTRDDTNTIAKWLAHWDFPAGILVNSVLHNPPNTSSKPIGEVYFDDRDAHCVGEMPYNWHKAMARVRSTYQPPLDTGIADAMIWAEGLLTTLAAWLLRRRFAKALPQYLNEVQKLTQTQI